MHIIVFLLDGKVTYRVPQGLILGSLPFLIYFNSLLKITDNDAKGMLIADDASLIVTTSNQGGFRTVQPKHSLI
jgi:hypothetical protein